MNNEYSIVITAYPDKESAKRTAQLLVKMRLAACVQIIPIESIYFWQDKICEENEITLHIKSKTALFEKIAATIRENHSYELPEIIQIPITGGSEDYLAWIDDSAEKQ
jgi:periplasmic divalent cation tolerance protein